jgi:rhodanese-related sulfurtransferase
VPVTIDLERADALVAAGAQVVDVLPPSTYAEEHLPGAVNVPLAEVDRSVRDRLDPARPVVVYCADFP